MAQIANGCKLQYTIAATGKLSAAIGALVWSDIEDATNIPELVGSTSAVEVTRIIDKAKIYIPGIVDNGGNMDFTCHWTKELLALVDAIAAVQDTKEVGFRVVFPAPADCQLAWTGKVAQVTNEAIESEGVIGAKLSIFPGSAVVIKATADVTNENPFK